MLLTIGDPFPEFSLTALIPGDLSTVDADAPEDYFTTVDSQSYAGKWKVVFFWPKDFTFVCPTEIAEFGRLNEEFADRDAQVLGASVDNEFVHFAWRRAHEDLRDLPFPMLSDLNRQLSSALGVLNADGVADRATFLVDPNGDIQFVMVTAGSVGRNVQEVLRVLDALQTDELCACNWRKGAETIDVARQMVGLMSLETLKGRLPAYAKDLKLNLGSVLGGSTLEPRRLWGAVLGTAIASRDEQTLRELDEEVRAHLSAEEYDAARAAAAIMAMNNIYYRGKHLLHQSGVEGYDPIAPGLRMSTIGTAGGIGAAGKVDFEFWSFAVSAVNGCGQCLAAHEHVLREAGVPREQINDALRIASVVHAVAVTLAAESVLSPA